MRKILIAALAVVLICCGASECSEMLSGVEDVRVEYIKTDYQVLNVSSAIAVEYSSDSDMMEITADRDMFPYIDVKRTGNILELKVRQNPFKNTGRIRVVLPVSGNLRWIDLSGASSFKASEKIYAPSFELSLSGASKLDAEIETEKLQVDASGASSLNIFGYADRMSIEASGASRISSQSSRVSSDDIEVSVSGASRVCVDCTGSISGSISGASSIIYGKNAKSVRISDSGASSARPE